MAKDKTLSSEEKAAKKAAKAAKKESQKRSETDGVHKKSSSNSKKDKTAKAALLEEETKNVETTTKLLNELEAEKPGTVVVKDDEEGNMEIDVKQPPLLSALVPFANPLADEKVGRKVLRSVK